MISPFFLRVSAGMALLLVLSGCGSTPGRMGEAATTPLNDLNLLNEKIPDVLRSARKHPYALPETLSCPSLNQDIEALDKVLGADLDTKSTRHNPSLLERGQDAAEDAAVDGVRRTAQDFIPFRGWVRKLSGAERQSNKVSAAITAGGVRRAFLKGLRAAQACTAVAVQGEPSPKLDAGQATPIAEPAV